MLGWGEVEAGVCDRIGRGGAAGCGVKCRQVWSHDAADTIAGVCHLRKFVTEAVLQCELLRDLPGVLDEEPVAPLGDGALDLRKRRGEAGWLTTDEGGGPISHECR